MYQSKWAPQPPADEEKPPSPRPDSSSKTLSAAAPSFSPSPAPPPPDVSSTDTFAQTSAAQDDLFDDVVPIDGSMRVRSEDDLFSDDFTPVEQPIIEQPASAPLPSRGRDEGQRSRGRGRGRAAIARGSIATNVRGRAIQENESAPQSEQQPQAAPPENAPTGPKKESVPSSSVRGDRQATGGIRKPKLTEDELAEKMAAIQIKNANLTAAHARAEADAASFAEREQQAKQVAARKQKVERRDRQQMMGERERNRMRKLKAMEGREWDAEKKEEDFAKGGRADKKGGFAGDREDYNDGREYLYREPRGGGGGGGGRGGRGERWGGERGQEQTAPKQEDFPTLPVASKADSLSTRSTDAAPTTPVKSWADQVEASNTT